MHRSKITLSIPEIQSKFLHISCKNSHTTYYTALWRTVNIVTNWYTTDHPVCNNFDHPHCIQFDKKSNYRMREIVLWKFCCFSMEDKYFLLPAILFTIMGFLNHTYDILS